MKTTVHPATKAKFPKLQKDINGNIFLMCAPQNGTCIYNASNSLYFLGHYYTNIPSEDLSDCNDTLILEN